MQVVKPLAHIHRIDGFDPFQHIVQNFRGTLFDGDTPYPDTGCPTAPGKIQTVPADGAVVNAFCGLFDSKRGTKKAVRRMRLLPNGLFYFYYQTEKGFIFSGLM
ncbi:MAG: hypothetical protein ACYSO4_07325, partial [Planctomycetota bacterium]